MKLLLMLSVVSTSLAGQILTYTKSFPGSVPAWVQIRIAESGDVEYREDPKDELPLRFSLKDSERISLIELASKLGNFTKPLESPAKVANMGLKTFHYEKGAETHEVKFNYSEDLDARALNEWFEKIIETEQGRIDLERSARFEKLGVDGALLRIEISWNKKRLIAPEQFLPLLDRISRNDSYLHMARSRAAGLAEHIRAEAK